MAELILKVGAFSPDHSYQDGDIVVAPNDRQIGSIHISHICDVRKAGFNSDGLRPDSLAARQQQETYQYRFDRVGEKVVLRTELATGTTELLSDTPNERGEAIDVSGYIARRKSHPAHRIFGVAGSEFWFGGRVDTSRPKIDLVWDLIEGDTSFRRADHKKFPLGAIDEKHFCAISTADYTDGMASLMTATQQITKSVDVGKRLCRVDYNALEEIAGPLKNQIANREIAIDVRDFAQFVPEEIVQVKGL